MTVRKTLGEFTAGYDAKYQAMAKMPVNASADDRILCHALVRELSVLPDVRSLCVHDGEEICLTYEQYNTASDDSLVPVWWKVLDSMSHTGENTIEAVDRNYDSLGWFHLIYYNGSEDDPNVCMSDHSANEWTKDVVTRIERAVEQGRVFFLEEELV